MFQTNLFKTTSRWKVNREKY